MWKDIETISCRDLGMSVGFRNPNSNPGSSDSFSADVTNYKRTIYRKVQTELENFLSVMSHTNVSWWRTTA